MFDLAGCIAVVAGTGIGTAIGLAFIAWRDMSRRGWRGDRWPPLPGPLPPAPLPPSAVEPLDKAIAIIDELIAKEGRHA